MKRSSGILLPIFSLPSPHGIGTFGAAAYRFADFLAAARQQYWQMLPLGPTGYGDSPYQSASTFAGNPYLIDLDLLEADGLLTRAEIAACDGSAAADRIDYAHLYATRRELLLLACNRGTARDREAVEAFAAGNADWLYDYALFAALKAHFGGQPWMKWPDDIRLRGEAALAQYRELLAGSIEHEIYIQFLFDRQWRQLREYLKKKRISVIGDVPIYVPLDSADVWQHPQLFMLDDNRIPTLAAGVPPDYFSEAGQLWGNPVYDWKAHGAEGYAWWKRRIGAAAERFDVVRIDHFRGLESYWAVPFGETTAVNGQWHEGPGMQLIDALKAVFPTLWIIAEDLGFRTEGVEKLLQDSGFPGMRVTQFGFEAYRSCEHTPHNIPEHAVVYTGTHDNATAVEWLETANVRDAAFAVDYLGLSAKEGLHIGMVRGALMTRAQLAVIPIQDYLGLGAAARLNTPNTLGGQNWQFRLTEGQLTEELSSRIAHMTAMYDRG